MNQTPNEGWIHFAGPERSLQVAGVKLLGVDAHNGHKLLMTLALLVVLYVFSKIVRGIANAVTGRGRQAAFWTKQGTSLLLFVLGVLGVCSIWFDNPARLTTGVGLFSAGVAFAMQKVITSFAGYFVILRGKTFNVGDRIRMGGVRGDVISLNFIQTVIMEMGQPPAVEDEDPGMWVHSRQYSGRIVTISNSEIFEQPVYNYTRDFPYIWEEMHLPISYKDDRVKAEQILLDAVKRHTTDIANMAQPEIQRLKEKFFIEAADIHPRTYLRLTDNWVELSARFLCGTHDVRGLKDKISRELLSELEAAGIGIASGTYEIVGLPPVRVEMDGRGEGQSRVV